MRKVINDCGVTGNVGLTSLTADIHEFYTYSRLLLTVVKT